MRPERSAGPVRPVRGSPRSWAGTLQDAGRSLVEAGDEDRQCCGEDAIGAADDALAMARGKLKKVRTQIPEAARHVNAAPGREAGSPSGGTAAARELNECLARAVPMVAERARGHVCVELVLSSSCARVASEPQIGCMTTRRLLCLHGHFYQPPRENPWIEAIEVQDSAEPFHDWNERIAAECYAPNAAARLKSAEDRIVDIVSNYDHLSFNFGPTLLVWLERERPDVSRARARGGSRGASSGAATGTRSRRATATRSSRSPPRAIGCTQIRWGIADFRRRFGRAPEGFWLPETAADAPTLEALAAEGIRFTVLSPYQARRVRPPGGEWLDATGARFDPTRPYLVRAGEREITVFFYDGNIARDLAFGDALSLAGGARPAPRGRVRLRARARRGPHHRLRRRDARPPQEGRRRGARGGPPLLARRDDLELVNLAQALDRCRRSGRRRSRRAPRGAARTASSGWRTRLRVQRRRPARMDARRGARRSSPRWRRCATRSPSSFERDAGALFADPWARAIATSRWCSIRTARDADDFVRREAGAAARAARRS